MPAKSGIVFGFGDGTFGADRSVTLEQLAAILYRYAGFKGYPLRTGDVEAAFECSDWAETCVRWAVSNGILPTGRPMTEPAARAEIAGAIRVFLENLAKN